MTTLDLHVLDALDLVHRLALRGRHRDRVAGVKGPEVREGATVRVPPRDDDAVAGLAETGGTRDVTRTAVVFDGCTPSTTTSWVFNAPISTMPTGVFNSGAAVRDVVPEARQAVDRGRGVVDGDAIVREQPR